MVMSVACHPSRGIIASVGLEKVRSPSPSSSTHSLTLLAQDPTVRIFFDKSEASISAVDSNYNAP